MPEDVQRAIPEQQYDVLLRRLRALSAEVDATWIVRGEGSPGWYQPLRNEIELITHFSGGIPDTGERELGVIRIQSGERQLLIVAPTFEEFCYVFPVRRGRLQKVMASLSRSECGTALVLGNESVRLCVIDFELDAGAAIEKAAQKLPRAGGLQLAGEFDDRATSTTLEVLRHAGFQTVWLSPAMVRPANGANHCE